MTTPCLNRMQVNRRHHSFLVVTSFQLKYSLRGETTSRVTKKLRVNELRKITRVMGGTFSHISLRN